jgi:hypothetical protein
MAEVQTKSNPNEQCEQNFLTDITRPLVNLLLGFLFTLTSFIAPHFYTMSQITADLSKALPLIASGKVRELYEVDANTLLFVASDRISAYDVIMDNVSLRLVSLPSHVHSLIITVGHPQQRHRPHTDDCPLVRVPETKAPRSQNALYIT